MDQKIIKPLLWLAILLVVVGIGYTVSLLTHVPTKSNPVLTYAIPAFSSSTAAQLQKSHGFQYLVSYTDRGFEPVNLKIKKGETIRFTNNSSGDLWIAATGNELYPRITDSCGSSTLDSCGLIAHGEFWEFTFDQPGTWQYRNNQSKSRTGTITVR